MTIQYAKPAVRGAWADLAPVWNGSTGDIADPGNSFVEAGWQQSTTPPQYQYMNWALNYASEAIRYFMQRGIVDWDAAELYNVNDIVQNQTSTGYCWVCVQNNCVNIEPGTNAAYWVQAFTTPAQLNAAIAPLASTAFVESFFAQLSGAAFTGNVSFPTQAGGTNNGLGATTAFVQAALAAYLTSAAAAATYLSQANAAAEYTPLSDFSWTLSGGGPGGHYVFPGGLILNWGNANGALADQQQANVSYSKAYTAAVFCVLMFPDLTQTMQLVNSAPLSYFTWQNGNGSNAFWIALGV